MDKASRSEKAFSHLLMLIFSILISGSFIFGSLIANKINPSAISMVRFFIAFLTLALIIKAFDLRKSDLKIWMVWKYFILGCLIATYFVLMFEGLKTSPSTSLSAVLTLTPLIAAILEFVFFKKKISKFDLVAFFIGALGAMWIIFEADKSKFFTFDIGYGEAIFLIGCICQVTYTMLLVKLNSGESTIEQTSVIMLFSGIILIFFDFKVIFHTEWLELEPLVWITIGYLSIFATAAAFFIIQYSRKFLPSSYLMAYYYLVPMWVLIFEIIFFQSVFAPKIWIGFLAIICAFSIILYKDIKL